MTFSTLMEDENKEYSLHEITKQIFSLFDMREADVDAITNCIHSLYSTEYRKYHAVRHLIHIFHFARKNEVELTPSQMLAILFHDIIYVPGNKENEDLSASFAKSLLKPFVQANVLETACNIILDTKQHFNTVPDYLEGKSKLVLDLDISSMSLDYEQFLWWNKLVEEEFEPFGFNDINKRIQFFEMFLSKKSIIQTEQMSWMEEPIRNNIKRYLEELKAK